MERNSPILVVTPSPCDPSHHQLKRRTMNGSTSRWRDNFDLGIIGSTHGLSDGFSSLLKPVLALIVVDLGLSTFDAGVLLSVFSVSTFLFLYPLSLLADYSGQKKSILLWA